MKLIYSALATLFALTATLAANAQTTAPPVAQTPAAAVKLALIETDAFGDQNAGIKRLLAAFTKLETELKPKRDEIAALRTRYDQLVKEINDTRTTATQQTLSAKADQAESLKLDIERKQQDGQKLLERRSKELTEPIYQDIGTALKTFATQRGFDIVIDISKLQGSIMILNQGVDITDAFIADYNTKNPATAAVTPTRQP